jgi:hypothetical protein
MGSIEMTKRPKTTTGEAINARDARFINHVQVGGIETFVPDNGPGRGVRSAWVNTGSPLRYKVLIDRGLDISEAFYAEKSLTFLSLTGATPPTRALDGGLDWLWGFYGGLVCSCGPVHAGAPAVVDGVAHGLHGTHSNTPAELGFVCQPDPGSGLTDMSLTGTVRAARLFGPNIELTRTIRSTLGKPVIHIHDCLRNRGNTAARHCWMLHINFGWPLLDAGSVFVYRGDARCRPGDEGWFEGRNYKVAPAPVSEHAGTGEGCIFIDPPADRDGNCHVGLVNPAINLGVEIAFPKRHFPRIVNWQHFGAGEYVTGVEPFSGGMGEAGLPAGELASGETRDYDCTLTVLSEPAALAEFVKKWG